MPTIEQNLASILAARYGRDVRTAIHDSIEQNYEDVSTARTLADGATDAANVAADLANTKAGLADAAAISANDAADLANTKAGLADAAATSANASTRFQHIKYSDYETPTDEQMNDTEGAYLGVCVTNSQIAPITAVSYTWNHILGEKGEKGETGDDTVYVGETEPENPDIQVWIDPSAGVNYVPPVRGVDYWTAEDIATIKDYIDTEILGGSS